MEIVVDTSVVMAVLLREPHRDRLIELTAGAELFAPETLAAEVGNALSSLLKRRRIDRIQAVEAAKAFLSMTLTPIQIDLEASVDLAAAQDIYAYDAYALHAAISRRSPLLTLDRGLAAAARRLNVNLIEVDE